MSLRFIYGRAGSGKSSFCLKEIKEKLENGFNGRLILIVPEQYSLQAERSLIAAIGRKGIIETEVLSFRRMAYRVFSEVGGLTFPHIDPSSKSMIISGIIDRLGVNLKVFGKAAGQKGFVNTLSTIISEFKRYGVTPEDLEKACSNNESNELLKNKLMELSSIYVEYEAAIKDKFRDADDDLTLLAQKLDMSEQFNGAEIWIDEFSGFTPQEYNVISKLLHKAEQINISLCTDCLSDEKAYAVMDVFYSIQAAAKKLINMAQAAEIAIKAPVVLNRKIPWRFENSPEIAHLEKNLQEYCYNRYKGKTRDISVFASVNIYSEVEEAAREILRLCRDEGFRYRDITVVSGNLDTYRKLVSAVFSEYGIPCFIDNKVCISVNPLVKMILAVFELISGSWSYETVFRYLKTGMTDVSREEIDVLENYVLACGIRGSSWTREEDWIFKTELSLDGAEAEDDERQKAELAVINEIRRKVSSPLLNFRSRTKGRKKAVDICTALYDLLCEVGVPERIQQMILLFRSTGRLALAGEYSQVWNAVMGVLDSSVDVLGDELIGMERFGEILELGLNECSIGLIPPSLDQVLVGSVNRSKNHAVKALFVLGANDGSFPSANVKEGILSDNDREALRKVGLELSSDTRTKAFEEQYMVYSTLTTAGCRLRLSYAIADHEGKTLRPSIIISQFKRIFPEINEYSNIAGNSAGDDNIELVSSPAPTLEQLAAVMRSSVEGEEVQPMWLDVYRWYVLQDDWKEKCRNAFSALSYTSQVGQVDFEKVGRLYGSPVYSSVSQFERYTACPFSYFIRYGLKAKDRKIFTITPPDVGTFMHTVIERFSRRVLEQGRSWRELEKDWCDDALSDIVEELLKKMQGTAMNGSNRFRSLTARLKRVLSRTVWLIVEHVKRSAFEPVGYEMVFGKDGDFPPITLELESGAKIYLTGRVDRIDAFKTENGTYLRIVDYKSGSKAFKLSDIYYGIQVQLITYLDAIEQSGGIGLERPILPGGMLYMKIDDPIIRGKAEITEEEIEKAIMRQMKMRGLVLADVKLIREMDRQIDGDSLIIPARINKGDVLGRSSAATVEQFEALRKYTRKLLLGIGEEMMKGDFSINPYKKKNITSCSYCDYAAICQFDPLLKGNEYRVINDKEDSEVWTMMGMTPGENKDK